MGNAQMEKERMAPGREAKPREEKEELVKAASAGSRVGERRRGGGYSRMSRGEGK